MRHQIFGITQTCISSAWPLERALPLATSNCFVRRARRQTVTAKGGLLVASLPILCEKVPHVAVKGCRLVRRARTVAPLALGPAAGEGKCRGKLEKVCSLACLVEPQRRRSVGGAAPFPCSVECGLRAHATHCFVTGRFPLAPLFETRIAHVVPLITLSSTTSIAGAGALKPPLSGCCPFVMQSCPGPPHSPLVCCVLL